MDRESLLEELSLIRQKLELIRSSRKEKLKFRVSDYAHIALERLALVEAAIIDPPCSRCSCCNGTGKTSNC